MENENLENKLIRKTDGFWPSVRRKVGGVVLAVAAAGYAYSVIGAEKTEEQFKINKYDVAINEWEGVLTELENRKEKYYAIGRKFFDEKDYESAAKCFEFMAENRGKQQDYFWLGTSLMEQSFTPDIKNKAEIRTKGREMLAKAEEINQSQKNNLIKYNNARKAFEKEMGD